MDRCRCGSYLPALSKTSSAKKKKASRSDRSDQSKVQSDPYGKRGPVEFKPELVHIHLPRPTCTIDADSDIPSEGKFSPEIFF